MKVRLQLDYATFNFDAGMIDLDRIQSCLANGIDLKFQQKSENANSLWISPFGLYYLENSGFAPRPHRLQVSGSGCSHFEAMLPYLRSFTKNHLSRVDFAFDVVISREKWKKYILDVINKTVLEQDRLVKKYSFAGSGEAVTVYIGSRKCAKFCRIYNKSLQDTDYTFIDESGNPYELKRDADNTLLEYVIRYEVELKHFKGKGTNFNPSYLFDSYFGDQKQVIDFVKSVWADYAADWLLPCCVDELEFTVKYDKQKFCSREDAIISVNNTLFDAPRVFDSSVEFIANRYGKYIPFIMMNPFLRNLVIQKCEVWCGFKLDCIVSISESGFYDLDEESNVSSPAIWEDAVEYIDITIESEV